MDIQTRFLRYFLAVAEEHSFSRAAVKLGVSQPALSQRMQDLEAQFGFELFQRGGRSIALSEQGQALVNPVRRVLAQAKQLESEIRDLKMSVQAPITLGATIYSDFPERTRLVTDFIEAHPEEKIELESGYTLAFYDQLLAGELDFAIIIGPPPEDSFDAIVLRWFDPEMIVPTASPLAAHPAIPSQLLRSASIASFRRKRHPALFDQVIQPLIDLGGTVHYSPDQSPPGLLAFAAHHDLVVPVGFPMHSDEQLRAAGMVRRRVSGAKPVAALQLVRARGHSTSRCDRFWKFAADFTSTTQNDSCAGAH